VKVLASPQFETGWVHINHKYPSFCGHCCSFSRRVSSAPSLRVSWRIVFFSRSLSDFL